MSNISITEQETNVNRLEEKPIKVILPDQQYYYIDMSIPFQGEPCYAGSSWGGSPEDMYGLEARG